MVDNTTLPGQRTKEQKQFLDAVEAIPSTIAEGAKGLASGAVDFLVGRDKDEEQKKDADLDSQIEALLQKNNVNSQIQDLADRRESSDLDAQLEELVGGIKDQDTDEPGVGGKILDRLLGEDVDDPMPFIRLGTTITGAVGGTVAGTKIGGTFGSVLGIPGAAVGAGVGAVTGTAIGAVAPEATQRFAEYFNIIDEDSEFSRKNMGLSPDELETLLEGEVLLELATGGGISAARLATRTGTRLFVGAGKEELLIAKRAKERGIDLLPIQVGKRAIPKSLVAIFGHFPLIVGPLKTTGEIAEAQIAESITTLSHRLAPIQRTADELGLKMFREAKGLAKAITKDFNKRYTDVYNLAEEFGVKVLPKNTTSKAARIINRLEQSSPKVRDPKTGLIVPGKLSKAKQDLVDFINENVMPTKGIPQDLKQMDTLVENLDEFLATLEPSQKKFVRKLGIELRQQAQRDMIENVRGTNAGEIAQRLRNIDKDYSFTVTDLIETSLAKQIARFSKKGLKGSVVDPVTTAPVDTMAKLIKLESPEAMSDLSKLVTRGTYAEIVSKVMDDAVKGSMIEFGAIGKQFDVTKFKRTLGLDNKLSSKYATLKTMLNKNKTIKIGELEDIVEAATIIERMVIPNASVFVARRLILGGAQSFVGTILPGATAGATARGGKGLFSLKTFITVGTFLVGGRGMMSAISDPKIIQPLRDVMAEEVSDVTRRNSYIKAMRLLISGAFGDEDQFISRIGGSETEVDTHKNGITQMFEIILQSLDQKSK